MGIFDESRHEFGDARIALTIETLDDLIADIPWSRHVPVWQAERQAMRDEQLRRITARAEIDDDEKAYVADHQIGALS